MGKIQFKFRISSIPTEGVRKLNTFVTFPENESFQYSSRIIKLAD